MSADDFEMFIQRIELLTDYMRDEKPQCIIFAGNFNGRCKQWWPEGNEDHQGIALDEFIEGNALFQLIDQPTHILENSKSCIDLIITTHSCRLWHGSRVVILKIEKSQYITCF